MNKEEIIVELANVKNSTDHAHKRIDELQNVIKAFYDLAADVKVMANELVNMKTDISDIKQQIANTNEEPKKLMFNIKNAIAVGVVAAIISSIMAIILK